jgi:hypothetical protein
MTPTQRTNRSREEAENQGQESLVSARSNIQSGLGAVSALVTPTFTGLMSTNVSTARPDFRPEEPR